MRCRWVPFLLVAAGCSPEEHAPLPFWTTEPNEGAAAEVWIAMTADTTPREGTRSDRVMIEPVDEAALVELCDDHGVPLLKPIGRSGVAAIGIPPALSVGEFVLELAEDPRIASVVEESWFSGAGTDSAAFDWHLTAISASDAPPDGLDDVVVAVVDSGVAWQNSGGVGSIVADGLSGAAVSSPWDFVEGDAHPQDEHQHGTHIASIIGGDGAVQGVAPGVGLMPLRVLDAHNQGSELELVEAIHWAADRGADVINMSLSFWPGYQPSEPLQKALDHAADAGVLLVAASGNDAWDGTTWPAASPRVLAVGAVCAAEDGQFERAPYSNHGVEVDVLAPGGCLDRDVDGDGLPDGIAAETIHADGSGTGTYLWSGTSQAAAVVSGAAARLIAEGAEPQVAGALLVSTADAARLQGTTEAMPWLVGLGAGVVSLVAVNVDDATAPSRTLGSLLPFLAVSGGDWVPSARVSVVDASGASVGFSEVAVRADGTTGTAVQTCVTDAWGSCTVQWPELAVDAGTDAALQWQMAAVGMVSAAGELMRLGSWIQSTGGLEVLLDAADSADALDETLVAWQWPEGDDPVLGALAPAWAFVDLSSGVVHTPGAVLATHAAVTDHGVPQPDGLDLDGSGLATSPMGLLPWSVVSLAPMGGSGLATSPMGVVPVDVVGIGSSDLLAVAGFHPTDVHEVGGSGLATSPMGVEEGPVDLGSGGTLGWQADSFVLIDRLEEGGMRATFGSATRQALVGVGLAMEPGWQGVAGSSPSAPEAVGGAQ